MKFDAQTLMLLALVAFVFMREQKKPPPLISDDTLKQMAEIIKAMATLRGSVSEIQKRIDELHSVSTAGY